MMACEKYHLEGSVCIIACLYWLVTARKLASSTKLEEREGFLLVTEVRVRIRFRYGIALISYMTRIGRKARVSLWLFLPWHFCISVKNGSETGASQNQVPRQALVACAAVTKDEVWH